MAGPKPLRLSFIIDRRVVIAQSANFPNAHYIGWCIILLPFLLYDSPLLAICTALLVMPAMKPEEYALFTISKKRENKAKKEKPAPVIEPSLGRSNVSREVTQVLEQLQLQMLTT